MTKNYFQRTKSKSLLCRHVCFCCHSQNVTHTHSIPFTLNHQNILSFVEIKFAQHINQTMLPEWMWVRKLSQALPCSKSALFISSVTLLRNDTMCTVGGRGLGVGGEMGFLLTLHCVSAFLVFLSAVTSWQRHYRGIKA